MAEPPAPKPPPNPAPNIGAEMVPKTAGELASSAAGHPDDDLPVVARMVVEIRSDGSRTIARGAIEDTHLGHRVAVEAQGGSPLALALALARSLGSLPRLSARAAVRGLLGKRSGK